MEEIIDIIGNYALVTDPQKREQIRAVITRHAADYQKKRFFPDPKTEITKNSDNYSSYSFLPIEIFSRCKLSVDERGRSSSRKPYANR